MELSEYRSQEVNIGASRANLSALSSSFALDRRIVRTVLFSVEKI